MTKSVKHLAHFFSEEDDDIEPEGMKMKDSPPHWKHMKIFFNFGPVVTF